MAISWRQILGLRASPTDNVRTARRGFGVGGGVHVSDESAMQVSAFYRGVMYISTQIAKLPWDVKDKNNKIIEDGVSALLNLCPNSEMNAMSFRLCMIQSAIIHGNAFAEIERDMIGRPVALWPLDPKSLELVRDRTGKLYYRVVRGSSMSPGEDVYLNPTEVFHLKNFHTKDGLIGQGVVSYAIDSLGISLGADRMAGNLFANGGMPSGVLTVPGALEEEAYKRIKASWDEAHTGRKTGGVAVLEEGLTFAPVTMDPDVLQFLESRKFSVLEIARFLNIPPTKLFDITAATYSNQEQSNLEVATDVLDAWACNLELEADVKLLNKRYGGKFTQMDLYAVFRGDMKTRSDYFKSRMSTASITPNEIRAREGEAPYEGGDRYYVAVNNYSPVDRLDEVLDSQMKPDPAPAPPERDANDQDPETKKLTVAALKYLEKQ